MNEQAVSGLQLTRRRASVRLEDCLGRLVAWRHCGCRTRYITKLGCAAACCVWWYWTVLSKVDDFVTF